MALTLVRHTTPNVAAGVCYGRTDLDVTPSFVEEAERVQLALPRVARIVSSPLLRCRKLAAHLAEAFGLSVELDDRFIEMDFGAWENIPWSDVPRDELDAWAADFVNARPHGGESVSDLRQRVMSGLSLLSEGTLVVTHAGVIKAALATGDTTKDFGTQIDYGGIVEMPSERGA